MFRDMEHGESIAMGKETDVFAPRAIPSVSMTTRSPMIRT